MEIKNVDRRDKRRTNPRWNVGKQGEHGEAKTSSRQTRLNAVDER